MEMTMKSRRDPTRFAGLRCLSANKTQKNKTLGEFTANTGYSRDYAILNVMLHQCRHLLVVGHVPHGWLDAGHQAGRGIHADVRLVAPVHHLLRPGRQVRLGHLPLLLVH